MGTLFVVTLPIEIGFLGVLGGVGWLKIPLLFIGFYIVFFSISVGTSLFVAKFLTNFLWSKEYDPDTYAMPVHSAMMDLIGQLLLVACYEFVNAIGGKVRTVTPAPP